MLMIFFIIIGTVMISNENTTDATGFSDSIEMMRLLQLSPISLAGGAAACSGPFAPRIAEPGFPEIRVPDRFGWSAWHSRL